MPIAKVVKTLGRTAPNWPHFNTRLFAMRFRPPYPAFSAFLHGALAVKLSPTAVNMSPTGCKFTLRPDNHPAGHLPDHLALLVQEEYHGARRFDFLHEVVLHCQW